MLLDSILSHDKSSVNETFSEFMLRKNDKIEEQNVECEGCKNKRQPIVEQEELLNEGLIDIVNRLLGRDATATVKKLSKAIDNRLEQQTIINELIKDVERGKILLKTSNDIDNFKNVAMQSGVYSYDGAKKNFRSDKDTSKHIDIAIAKNIAGQIKDNRIKVHINTFIGNVQSDDFCGM